MQRVFSITPLFPPFVVRRAHHVPSQSRDAPSVVVAPCFPFRHSRMLLSGIQSLEAGPPIKTFEGDGLAEVAFSSSAPPRLATQKPEEP